MDLRLMSTVENGGRTGYAIVSLVNLLKVALKIRRTLDNDRS